MKHIGDLPFPSRVEDVPIWVYHLHLVVHHNTGSKSPIPTYLEMKQRYAHATDVRPELTFVRSLVETHPGKYKATLEFTEPLTTFMKTWQKHSEGISALHDIDPGMKSHWSHWLSSQKQLYKNNHVRLIKCDTDVCSV